jgi:PAS domain S-box-containing protein
LILEKRLLSGSFRLLCRHPIKDSMNNPDQLPDLLFKFEHFFELSPDLLCIAGFDGYFRRINPAVSKLLGYSNEELLSQPISNFVYNDDKLITKASREIVLNSAPLINFENRYQTKDGDIVWLSWTSMPAPEDQLVYAIAKNVTAKKKLEEERNQKLANLTDINKELRHLSYTTTHDLRSPINNLLSLFSLLDVTKVSDPEIKEYLEVLKLTTDSLSEVLNNSVDNMIQKDRLPSNTEKVKISHSLNSVLISINSLMEVSRVKLTTDFTAFDEIEFNRAYLDSIFLNLITNSVKYAQPGITPVISIVTAKTSGIKQLIVTDNGMGFDLEKVKDKIFGLNQKFHDHSDSKGVGLYLVYNHVTNMNGTIDVISRINEGTKFVISFKE